MIRAIILWSAVLFFVNCQKWEHDVNTQWLRSQSARCAVTGTNLHAQAYYDTRSDACFIVSPNGTIIKVWGN